MEELIRVEKISKTYFMGEVEVNALEDVSFTIYSGEFVAIMGPSGSGKSTLLNILGCLDKPTKGIYSLEGTDISTLKGDEMAKIRNEKIGFVFQNFNLLPRSTVMENIELPLVYTSLNSRKRLDMARKALALVNLLHRKDHYPNQLSGGEQQRVAIARALVNNPSILLADEPTGNLDSQTSLNIIEVFKELNKKENLTTILITHNREIASHAQRTITLRDGRIILTWAYRNFLFSSQHPVEVKRLIETGE